MGSEKHGAMRQPKGIDSMPRKDPVANRAYKREWYAKNRKRQLVLARQRKASYGGTCEVCGARTDGSNGRANAPTICATCFTARQHAEKKWTRERIIDAIQRFAAENGRPPLSREWIRANHEKDYPARVSVYRSATNPNGAFETWNHAIAAAGFKPRTKGSRFSERWRGA